MNSRVAGHGKGGTCQYGCQKPIMRGRVDEEVEDADGEVDLGTLFDREGCDLESGFLCRNVPVPVIVVDFPFVPFVPPVISSWPSFSFAFNSYPIPFKNPSFLRSFAPRSLFNHPITRATRKSTTIGRTDRAM